MNFVGWIDRLGNTGRRLAGEGARAPVVERTSFCIDDKLKSVGRLGQLGKLTKLTKLSNLAELTC